MTSGWQRYPSASQGATSDPRWQRARKQALKRDGGQCQIQGPNCIGTATTVDKIIPAAQGGAPFDLDNLQSACRPCHDSKTATESIAGRNAKRKRRPPTHPADHLSSTQ